MDHPDIIMCYNCPNVAEVQYLTPDGKRLLSLCGTCHKEIKHQDIKAEQQQQRSIRIN